MTGVQTCALPILAAGGEEPLRVVTDRIAHWASVGAQISPTVARLVEQAKKKVAA